MAFRGCHKAMANMDNRTKELESELAAAKCRYLETNNRRQKSERYCREIQLQQQEDRQNHDRMEILVEKLQQQLKSYKLQIEEAEQICSLLFISSAHSRNIK